MYRVAQLVGHVIARVSADEEALARELLPAEAWPLFCRMPVADRRHGLDVLARLLAWGHHDRDLLIAALLHDAAKGRRMRLAHRVGGVLLEALSPRALRRLARSDPGSWRHGFHLYLHHAIMSAEAARRSGCSDRSAGFIAGASDPADRHLLAALHAADEAT